MAEQPKVEYRIEQKETKTKTTREIIDALLAQENALNKLEDNLKNSTELDELFNSSERPALQRYVSKSESQLKTIRGIIERRLKALKANNKHW